MSRKRWMYTKGFSNALAYTKCSFKKIATFIAKNSTESTFLEKIKIVILPDSI